MERKLAQAQQNALAVKLDVAEAEVKGLFAALDGLAEAGKFQAHEIIHQKLSKAQAKRNAAFTAWIESF